jgi:hypothetical protein
MEQLIADALSGRQPSWALPRDAASCEAFIRHAGLHGVCPLLHDRGAGDWPEDVLRDLKRATIRHAMWELSHQHALARVLAGFARRELPCLLLKGTALAYSLYANPVHRVRADTDLMVAPHDRDRAATALMEEGFERISGMPGELATYQASFDCEAAGAVHTIDLHWKFNNSQVLAALFEFDELDAHKQPIPELAAHAWRPADLHSLLIACTHRLTHVHNPYYFDATEHHEADRLIWLTDIRLLTERIAESGRWPEFTAMASAKSLLAVCHDGIRAAERKLDWSAPLGTHPALQRERSDEKPWRYLRASAWKQHWLDLFALGNVRQQARWIREHLFPSPAYMRRRYPDARLAWLPWLYARRLIGGLRARLTAQ